MDIACPECGESENLSGSRSGDTIRLTCGSCGCEWDRNPVPFCQQCGGTDMRAIPLAIVEKSRGTQLSVVGTRTIHLCEKCDVEAIERWHRNRPNPLMPDELPTVGKVGED
jgi:hypothetical protein